MNGIERGIASSIENRQNENAKAIFNQIVQGNQYVGELYSINYESAKVQIHDSDRQKVGGIPSLSFLIATRVEPAVENVDFKSEDSSLILLRVMDATQLPNSSEAERIRVDRAQNVSGETAKHWDSRENMDAKTKVYLGYAAVSCRIIGTFFLDQQDPRNDESPLILKFGCDISNYYPNRGLKVYKPSGTALEQIVNYIDPFAIQSYRSSYNNIARVRLGRIRYASTDRRHQNIDNVPISIFPNDLLAQKSAVFGMTRTGKSNTVKIIAKSVYELRYPTDTNDTPLRIGQIILDPNGEYANENVQDNNSALKNIWQIREGVERENEVVTYGITPHPNDPERRLMLLNFYTDDNLQIGKDIINSLLAGDTTIYMRNFVQVAFGDRPDTSDRSAFTRFSRRVLAYRSVLYRAGFTPPTNIRPSIRGLFNRDLLAAMQGSTSDNAADYQSAANIFSNQNPTWGQLADAFENLDKFIRDRNSGYQQFESTYVNRPNGSGERWADEDLKKVIGIFQYANGTRKIGEARVQHTESTSTDYADDVYNDLVAGKLVIIDQSSGEPDINKSSAERIMWSIFRRNQELFRQGERPEQIMMYVEEAHNVLPSGSDLDLQNVWVRTAKEGAKYNIGLVYSTQEVSSIQRNVLKNTANWFIGHLNNTDETKELTKYYDFADFEKSIRRTQDKGFLRVKTLSNYFVIPVQVKMFDVTDRT
jgi:hypothetical protein